MHSRIKNRDLLRSQAYINGKWVDGKKSFSILNPFDQKEIGKVADLGAHEADLAIQAARKAFPSWSSMLASQRQKLLFKVARLIEEHADDLAYILTLEQGKPLVQAKDETVFSAEVGVWFAEEACRVHGYTGPDPDETRNALTIRQPVGVVAVITPWNFPFALPVQKCFAALAAGCTVVLKPAEDTPLTSLALAYLMDKAGIPAGVFNVVTCADPQEVGAVLTSHPDVGMVTFTGSTEVGKKILAQSASTVKKVALELGGNCPCIVFEDANLEKAVADSFSYKFNNAGQCCNSLNRFLVHSSIYKKFVEQFSARVKGLSVGSGVDDVDVGPLINLAAHAKVHELVEDATKHGAKIAVGKLLSKQGALCSPLVITNAHPHMLIWREEIFGPVAVIYPFETEEEAIAMANDTRYGLAAYFYTENLARAMRVSRALEAGGIGVNTTQIYTMMLPFGGWKESGLGREGGLVESLNDFCEVKSISFSK